MDGWIDIVRETVELRRGVERDCKYSGLFWNVLRLQSQWACFVVKILNWVRGKVHKAVECSLFSLICICRLSQWLAKLFSVNIFKVIEYTMFFSESQSPDNTSSASNNILSTKMWRFKLKWSTYPSFFPVF